MCIHVYSFGVMFFEAIKYKFPYILAQLGEYSYFTQYIPRIMYP